MDNNSLAALPDMQDDAARLIKPDRERTPRHFKWQKSLHMVLDSGLLKKEWVIVPHLS